MEAVPGVSGNGWRRRGHAGHTVGTGSWDSRHVSSGAKTLVGDEGSMVKKKGIE